MKFLLIYTKSILFYLFLPIITFASWYSQHDKGPHAGNLKKSEGYFIELKKVDKFMYAYLLDEQLKTISSRGISATIKFFLADSSTVVTKLKPFAEDAFVCEAPGDFQQCLVTFVTSDRNATALFENQKLIVHK